MRWVPQEDRNGAGGAGGQRRCSAGHAFCRRY